MTGEEKDFYYSIRGYPEEVAFMLINVLKDNPAIVEEITKYDQNRFLNGVDEKTLQNILNSTFNFTQKYVI